MANTVVLDGNMLYIFLKYVWMQSLIINILLYNNGQRDSLSFERLQKNRMKLKKRKKKFENLISFLEFDLKLKCVKM